MTKTKEERLKAFKDDIAVVDKYANENGTVDYHFKLWPDDPLITIDELFPTAVYHGPPK